MVYIFLYLFLEVMVSTFFASFLGGLFTFIEIILSAMLGIYLLKSFQFSINENIRDLTSGNITQDEFMAKNLNHAIGAIMLIIPGFLTDILGIFMFFGILTFLVSKIFTFKPKKDYMQTSYNYTRTTHANNTQYKQNMRRENNEEIIDVEVIDTTNSIK